MAERIGWAILGTGVIARKFAAALRSLPDARLVATLSRRREQASAFAAAAGDSATRGFDRLDELLALPDVDIVYVATPNQVHAEQTIACLDAGKAVLCEKPLATSAAEARAIAEAAKRSGRFCMEAMWTLCLPALARARALVAEGRIGAIREISGSLSYGRVDDPASRFLDPALGGGALLDLGVYPLSIALSFLGKPERISGALRFGTTGVDVQAAMALGWPGAVAHLACGFHAEGPNAMTITGERGVITLQRPLNAPALVTLRPTPAPTPYGVGDGGVPAAIPAAARHSLAAIKQMLRPFRPGRTKIHPAPFRGDGFADQIEEAMACLRAGRTESALVPLSLSVAVQETIEALRS